MPTSPCEIQTKQVLVAAKEEARRLNHGYIGTEHLLIALAQGEGVAAKVLEGLGVGEDQVRGAVEHIVQRGKQPPAAEAAFTPRAKRSIDLATEESRELRHNYVGTEHLLLGLLRDDDREVKESVGLRVVEQLRLQADDVRRAVLRALSTAPEQPQARGYVVTCRVDERTLNALDELVEAGVYATRSEAAARLIAAGMQANQVLVERVHTAVAEIRRVREETQALARQWEEHDPSSRSARRDLDAAPDAAADATSQRATAAGRSPERAATHAPDRPGEAARPRRAREPSR